MRSILREYLELERLMLVQDLEELAGAADSLRDAMDLLWYRLDDAERRLLNDRTIGRITSLEDISLRVGSAIFDTPPATPPATPLPRQALTGWAEAA